MKKINLKIFLIFFILIGFMQVNNFFLNVYNIANMSYEHRSTKQYGYCEKWGYGFIRDVEKKYNLSNVKVENLKSFSLSWVLFNPTKKKSFDKIFINLDKNFYFNVNKTILTDNRDKKKYKVLFSNLNCAYVK